MLDVRREPPSTLFITLPTPRTYLDAEDSARELIATIEGLEDPTVVLDIAEIVVCPSILLGAIAALGQRSRLRLVNATDPMRAKLVNLRMDGFLSISA